MKQRHAVGASIIIKITRVTSTSIILQNDIDNSVGLDTIQFYDDTRQGTIICLGLGLAHSP